MKKEFDINDYELAEEKGQLSCTGCCFNHRSIECDKSPSCGHVIYKLKNRIKALEKAKEVF